MFLCISSKNRLTFFLFDDIIILYIILILEDKYMPKGKKRYKRKDNPRISENVGYFGKRQKPAKTVAQSREHLKLFLFMITWIIILTGIYMLCIQLEFEPVMLVYTVLGVILFFVWFFYNGGFRKIEPEKMEKPEDESYESFCEFIEKLKERQRKAKYFLILFIPFPMIMLIDFTIIVWGERLAR